jgi:hypothetical protein
VIFNKLLKVFLLLLPLQKSRLLRCTIKHWNGSFKSHQVATSRIIFLVFKLCDLSETLIPVIMLSIADVFPLNVFTHNIPLLTYHLFPSPSFSFLLLIFTSYMHLSFSKHVVSTIFHALSFFVNTFHGFQLLFCGVDSEISFSTSHNSLKRYCHIPKNILDPFKCLWLIPQIWNLTIFLEILCIFLCFVCVCAFLPWMNSF